MSTLSNKDNDVLPPPGVDDPVAARLIDRHLMRDAIDTDEVQAGAKVWARQPANYGHAGWVHVSATKQCICKA